MRIIRCTRNAVRVLVLLTTLPGIGFAQAPARSSAGTAPAPPETPQQEALDLLFTEFKAQPNESARAAFVSSPANFARYLAASGIVSKAEDTALFHRFEESRIDVETSVSAASGGTTSVASKGSVPSLLGFAVEHGALTQSVESNQIIFRGNVANAVAAMKFRDYISSYVKLHEQNAIIRNIAQTSFSVSFNAASNGSLNVPSSSGTSSSFAGATVHYDIYNHRDPRDAKWINDWANVRQQLTHTANASGAFRRAIESQDANWPNEAKQALTKLGAHPTDDQIKAFLKELADEMVSRFGSLPSVRDAAQALADSLVTEGSAVGAVESKIMHSPTFSFEYSYVRQSNALVPNVIQGEPASLSSPLPNLSNFNLILNSYLVAGSQVSLNASTTLFDSVPMGSNIGRVRDFRVAGEVDIPLPEIASVGKPILTFSGMYVDLMQQPLGQPVLINGVAESRTGSIGLFQSKFTIPVKGSGIRIPLSFTVANRTELIKETDVRGSFGITFNLDSLFSKP